MIRGKYKSKKQTNLLGVLALAFFLPLLFVYYLYCTGFFNVKYCIPVAYVTKEAFYDSPIQLIDTLNVKFNTFKITGNIQKDKVTLLEARHEMKKLIASKDTLKAIRFSFEKKSRYNEYIQVLDMCSVERIPTFFALGYDLYLINLPKPKSSESDVQPIYL